MIEAGKGDFFDQLHQLGNTLGKKVKNEIAKRRVFHHQRRKTIHWQRQQGHRCFGDASRVVVAAPQ
ncbi:MAG: hypothetical protein IPJ50_11930 [Betaproteobacteria bacterium]|nr:hypothetical protein [Betaproteobacteria bacterium]